jgi:hypothetical protein
MRKYVMEYNPQLYQRLMGYQVFKATLQSRKYFNCLEKEGALWV